MKLAMPRLQFSLVLLSIAASVRIAALESLSHEVAVEDETFWSRFLRKDSFQSVPPETLPPVEECLVDVELECTLSDGRSCDTIQPPSSGECAVGSDIRTLALRFLGTPCDSGANSQGEATTCEDLGPVDISAEATIACQGSEGESLEVDPAFVFVGDTFTVTGSEGEVLPGTIGCAIFDADGNELQRIVLDSSGEVQLNLNDAFGSFLLEGCDRDGEDITCVETLNYEVVLENIGTSDMTVTVVDFTFNDQTASFLEDLEVNPLEPGQSTTLEVSFDANVCRTTEFIAAVDVEAAPPSGDMCQDSVRIIGMLVDMDSAL